MAKFALYYIPPVSSKLYEIGSQVLGYDILNNQKVNAELNLINKIGTNPNNYVKNAIEYGFHLTITDAIEFDLLKINEIEKECEELFSCFAPDTNFSLLRSEKFLTTSPPHDSKIILLGLEPNDNLKILHTLLVSRLHPMGKGSLYTEWLRDKIEYFEGSKNKIAKSRKFFTPTAFDQYFPHFTLMNPYTGSNRETLVENLDSIFNSLVPNELVMDAFYLVVKDKNYFEVVREFKRGSYPC